MLRVKFHRDAAGRLSGFSARGHADFAEHGQDIVCAAVSAILQAARLGLELHCTIKPEAEQQAGELSLHLSEADRDREGPRAIVTTAAASVAEIARRFPKHVTLDE
jgi:uncharacterized protein YsxB (DUF464 family)